MPTFVADRSTRNTPDARALRLIARAEKRVGLFETDGVDALLERALEVDPGNQRARARVLSIRVPLERQRCQYDRALEIAREALVAWRAFGDKAAEVNVGIEIGRVLVSCGDTSGALSEGLAALEQLESIVEEEVRRKTRLLAWRLLAYVYLSLEQFEQAIDFCERVVAGARVDRNAVLEGAVSDCMGFACSALATRATAAGEHDRACDLIELSLGHSRRALALAREGGHRVNEATALANIAARLVSGGRPAEALLLMESWSVDRIRNLPSIASHHFDTHGSICMALGRYDNAISLFTQACDSAKQANLSLVACEHLAEAYERVGDFQAALAHQKRFHALFRQAASDAAQRSAKVAAIRLETRESAALADHHRLIADELRRDHERLTRHADDLAVLSRCDALTGLANRRVLEDALRCSPVDLGIVMVDVDRFKAVNDGWSHLVGDSVLRTVALLIKSCCREVDTAVRYGGDEFAVLLPQADEQGVFMVAERIRDVIDSFDWESIAADLAVTVSVGCSAGSSGVPTVNALALADRGLLAAKKGGRNRVGGKWTIQ